MKNMKKIIALVAALVLVLAIGIGGTLAYLTSTTNTITNTFTVGKVKITLVEHKYNTEDFDAITTEPIDDNGQSYKLIPGTTYAKDPTVTVEKGSEACYLFVKVETVNTPSTYLNYSINVYSETNTTGWNELSLSDVDYNVYYIKQDAVGTGDDVTAPSYSVLKDNKVTVKTGVGSEKLPMPTGELALKFTAYAIQESGFESVAKAWTALQTQLVADSDTSGY